MPNETIIDKEAFKRWLARQPDDREFNYVDNEACLFCAFAKEELGWMAPNASTCRVVDKGGAPEMWLPGPFASAAARAPIYSEFRNSQFGHFTIADFRTELAKQLHRENL